MNDYLSCSAEVRSALDDGGPVIALESTIISHGFPYPANVECARECERIAREEGVTPATIAILGGRLKVGLSGSEIEHLGTTKGIAKASRRDIPVLLATGTDGATTVAGTMLAAALAGIRVFATGGIGGAHRGAELTMDISADLLELGRTEVAVVCAGAKSVLDIGLTLEVLETHGVPVIGFRTDDFPSFYTRSSGFPVDWRLDSTEEIAAVLDVRRALGIGGGTVVAQSDTGRARACPDGCRGVDRDGARRGGRCRRPRQSRDAVPARTYPRALGWRQRGGQQAAGLPQRATRRPNRERARRPTGIGQRTGQAAQRLDESPHTNIASQSAQGSGMIRAIFAPS